jgi:hypothetical protein
MLACVMGLGPSLLFLAPVLIMVGMVFVAKLRNNGEEDEFGADPMTDPSLDTADFPALESERELETV